MAGGPVTAGGPVHPGSLGPLTDLAGVGPARAALLARLGIESIRDLLLYAPRRLDVVGPERTPGQARAAVGTNVTVEGEVTALRSLRRGRRGSLLRIRVEGEDGSIDALFFNQPWLRERIAKGERVRLQGRVVATKSGPALAVPRVETEERPLPAPGSLLPGYGLTAGLTQTFLRDLCARASAEHAAALEEPLRAEDLARVGALPLPRAARLVHAPPDLATFHAARRRLALEPFLALQVRLAGARRRRRGTARAIDVDGAAHARLLGALPFAPTADQARVMGELRADLGRTRPMRRLLQGDVGSGKTAVGFYACAAAALAGGQAAFMAPTELLAEQHAWVLAPLLEATGLRAGLLTASLPGPRRRALLAQVASGRVQVLFGTHALFSEDVAFRRGLDLAVIDEQQRFGVAQRARLLEKGRDVHVLLMTATPIPRTLALSLYGDLDQSVLREGPPGRGGRRTQLAPGNDAAAREKVERFLARRLEAGERALWVAPRIEGEEPGGAEAIFERLSAGPLARFGVELVHGRLAGPERERRLARFRRGRARLLVGTTVIEVGLDVPEATVMVVDGAERFGLAQLHQLRGRVGRGERPGWCVLLAPRSARERLAVLEETEDGFAIAEEDLKRRGMGELAGLRQAGEGFVEDDVGLLLAAREIVAGSPELASAYASEAVRAVGTA